jgi:hypothetical protein
MSTVYMVFGIIIMVVTSLICTHFGIGMEHNGTGSAIPTSIGESIGSSLQFFFAVLSFSIPGVGIVISTFFWLISVLELLYIVALVRGN